MTQRRGLGLRASIAAAAALFVLGLLRPLCGPPARRPGLAAPTRARVFAGPPVPAAAAAATPDELVPELPPEAPCLPEEGVSVGPPGDGGALVGGLRLPGSPLYDLRCRFNAYAAGYTAERLLAGLVDLRTRYTGQIVLGDLSRRHGGPFGSHASHQSGRDVDIWLPVRGGAYSSAPACARCGTDWCRPEPGHVDWAAAWQLVAALDATRGVQNIFLDRTLHPELAAAALAAGLAPEQLPRMIQARPGSPALVLHSAGHVHHIHVRFRCDPDASECVR